MVVNNDTHKSYNSSFKSSDRLPYNYHEPFNNEVRMDFYLCPSCGEVAIQIVGVSNKTKGKMVWFQPNSTAKQFPDYIPQAIRQDYEEACAVVNLSPKSSATLARRCLQGIIRDFWGITENRLKDAIDKLQDKVTSTQWKVIDGVRRLGNIGAHMEKDINLIIDIDPEEADKLIKLIELLITQWYVERHNQEELFADIIGIDNTKQADRKKME